MLKSKGAVSLVQGRIRVTLLVSFTKRQSIPVIVIMSSVVILMKYGGSGVV